MTQEDDCSVYVGGLAYDSTEETLQKAFSTYGDINTIKIVYDRESGQSRGFGFVTFTNPRSAGKAIDGLDGQMIDGRTIRVNEVKKNSGKNLNRDGSFRDRGGKHRDGSRRGRNFSPHRHNRYSPPFGRRSGQMHSPGGSPGPGRSARSRSPDLSPLRGRSGRNLSPRSHSQAEQSGSFNSSSGGQPRGRSSPSSQSPQSSDRLHRVEERTHRTSALKRIAKEKQNDLAKVREELEKALQSRQELQDKVSNLTSKVEQAKETVSALQSKSQKLEESLANTLTSSAHRHQQLKKLQKGILQVRDSSERLKRQEKELKVLMDTTYGELDGMDGDTEDRLVSVRNGILFDADRKADDAS